MPRVGAGRAGARNGGGSRRTDATGIRDAPRPSAAFSWLVLWNTLTAALLTTVIGLVAGYPAAFALARAGGPLQTLLLVAVILPVSVGAVVIQPRPLVRRALTCAAHVATLSACPG